MSPGFLIAIIVLIVLCTSGGGWGWSRLGYYGGGYLGSGLGLLCAVIVIYLLLGGGRSPPW